MALGTPATSAAPPDAADATPVDWQRRARALEVLASFALEVSGEADPERIWAALRGRLEALVRADAAALAAVGLPAPRRWAAKPGAEAVAAALGEAVGQSAEAGELTIPNAGSALRVPLGAGGETVGALALAWSESPPDADAGALLRLLADHAAVALAHAREHARIADAVQRRERFFSAMSHDLRTPITAIVGYSELLADGIVGELARQQQEMVERISQVSQHLSQLVNDILDIAKLDAGRMEFHREPARIAELVDEALAAVMPQAQAKGLALRTELDAEGAREVRVDRPRVRQILTNLLSNAVKFTPSGEAVVRAGRDAAGTWIQVADTGPGLPPGGEEAMFEEFLQLASGNRAKREPGSGLGLALSRRLARAMGGDLRAENRAGGGAVFTLRLSET